MFTLRFCANKEGEHKVRPYKGGHAFALSATLSPQSADLQVRYRTCARDGCSARSKPADIFVRS